MSKMSVSAAAEILGISPMRVRQRIADGSLVAEKIGGRWLVDVSVSPKGSPRGRPANCEVVWDAIRWADGELHGPDLVLPSGSIMQLQVSASSRQRAHSRLLEAARDARLGTDSHGSFDKLFEWLYHRAERHQYLVSVVDSQPLRDDPRLIASGVSHPGSGMQDLQIIEGYVARGNLKDVIQSHWLDPVGLDQRPNVILHVAPGRPSEVSPLMLAADLAEHGGPREILRAHELLAEALK